ncbi:MAG: ABC transporter ATP-binding protein [Planctomycetota bacterium]
MNTPPKLKQGAYGSSVATSDTLYQVTWPSRQTQTPQTPRVLIDGVGFEYPGGPTVLANVSLTLWPGRVHCLLGPSGCGKTTMLRLLAGLARPTRGSIQIDGKTVSAGGRNAKCLPPERRAVGFVFQDYALFPHLSVLQNVTFGMKHRPRPQRRGAALDLLDRIGLADHANAMPYQLSGGQQQRVALARALSRDPRLMLLDEPFTGLDCALRDELRAMTLQVLRDADVATLMVTHDPAEALTVADIVSVINAGRIDVTAPPEQVCVAEPQIKGPPVVRLRCHRDDCPSTRT